MKNEFYDVTIIGGGMIGASMACALSTLPIKIAIIEAFPFRSNNQPSYDARSIALAYGSKNIFETLGIWKNLKNDASPINHIHISNQHEFGVTRLNAKDEKLDALGYVIENRVLGNALLEKIQQQKNINLICPATLDHLAIREKATVSIIQDEKKRDIQTSLIIAADGGNSKVRQLLNIDTKLKDYQQTAIISNVSPGKPHNNIAYERFTEQGPIAILPMTENRCSLVLSIHSDSKDAILSMNDTDFIQYLESRFGFRTGGFTKTSARSAYPLSLMETKEHVRQRVVIIGNAAHTIHPIAGQGFNLGIRDVATLADTISEAMVKNQDIGELKTLQHYQSQRAADQKKVIAITDNLTNIFSNNFTPLAKLRSTGLLFTDLTPPLKHFVSREAMGLSGRLPKLARGLQL